MQDSSEKTNKLNSDNDSCSQRGRRGVGVEGGGGGGGVVELFNEKVAHPLI